VARAREIDAILVTRTLDDLHGWKEVGDLAQTGLSFGPPHPEQKADVRHYGRSVEFEGDLIRERVKSGI
jgi:hypothetical protein